MTAALSDVQDFRIRNVDRELMAELKALCRAEGGISVNTKLKNMIADAVDLNRKSHHKLGEED